MSFHAHDHTFCLHVYNDIYIDFNINFTLYTKSISVPMVHFTLMRASLLLRVSDSSNPVESKSSVPDVDMFDLVVIGDQYIDSNCAQKVVYQHTSSPVGSCVASDLEFVRIQQFALENILSKKLITLLSLITTLFLHLVNWFTVVTCKFHCLLIAILLLLFSTPTGHYKWFRYRMGFRNSPLTYHCLINLIFQGLIGKGLFVYKNDSILVSQDVGSHFHRMSIVLQKFIETGL